MGLDTDNINRHAADITAWLIGPARTMLAPAKIVEGLVDRLRRAGVPLWRLRLGQSVTSPMISGWGVIWTRDRGIEQYTIERRVLSTGSFFGSPFEAVLTTRRAYRHTLVSLDPAKDHPVLLDLASAGGTDYYAVPAEYGERLLQVSAFTTDASGGFSDDDIALIDALLPAMGAAIEPAAMRHSTASLLEVYLGAGPAHRVISGEFQRGHSTEIDAAIVICDLRDYTGLSERLAPADLLQAMGDYFEIVVDAMRSQGGDVLKFIGDGVLSVFPVTEGGAKDACRRAVQAANAALANADRKGIAFVAAIHVGPVVYGNIGSPDQLDFTVVGSTVNYVSRLETIAKLSGHRTVCSEAVASILPAETVWNIGEFDLKGFEDKQRVFQLKVGNP